MALFVLLRNFACLALSISVLGTVRAGLFPLVSEEVKTDPPLLLRSFGQLGSSSSVFNLAVLDFSVFSKQHTCSDPFAPFVGLSCVELSLSVFDSACVEFPSLLQSFVRLGFPMSVFMSHHLSLPLLLQSHSKLEFAAFAVGMTWVGFVFALPVADCIQPGSFILLRQGLCMGFSSSVFNYGRLDSPVSLRSCACLALILSVLGVCCTGLALSMFDYATSGSTLSSRSFSHLGLLTLPPDLSSMGSSLSPQSSVQMDFSLLLSDLGTLDFPVSMRSSACVEVKLSATSIS